jgi:hypothetical protein
MQVHAEAYNPLTAILPVLAHIQELSRNPIRALEVMVNPDDSMPDLLKSLRRDLGHYASSQNWWALPMPGCPRALQRLCLAGAPALEAVVTALPIEALFWRSWLPAMKPPLLGWFTRRYGMLREWSRQATATAHLSQCRAEMLWYRALVARFLIPLRRKICYIPADLAGCCALHPPAVAALPGCRHP